MGPSTVLGGRYAVQRRLAQMPGAETWSAHDTTLERDVVVVCLPEDHPNAAAALDAARRAAGHDNHRLVRVLDVGRSDGIAFLVEEASHDAHTLGQLLEQGALPAEEARRIAGETATGLEAARARGLHHLRLTPHSVLRASDGTVKVRGVATAAALAGMEDLDSADASRRDAVGVVALTYAALTSRWPLPQAVPGVEPAPQLAGGVPAPSEIAAGVPGDLDALCRLTLNEDQGPLTPGDFATQIAPWASTQVGGLGTQPLVRDLDATLALPVQDLPPKPGDPQGAPPGGGLAAGVGGAAAGLGAAAGGSAAGSGSGRTRFEPTVRLPAPGAETGPGAETVPGDAAPATDAGAQRPGAGAATAAASAVGSALGSAGQAAGQAAGAAAQRVGTFARATADKAAARRAQKQAEQERAEQRRISLDQALVEDRDPLDPPLPMLPPETGEAPTRDQSKLVLLIIAGFLVVATVIGFWGASRIGANSHLGLGSGATPRRTVVVTAPPTTVGGSGSPSSSPTSASSSSGEPFPVLSATGYDPEGDGSERNSEAPRVFDGKDSTFWSSEGYASANLGGLKKGVGLRLDLGQPRKISQVTLVLPNTEDVTVYVGRDRNRDGSTTLGTSTGKSGTVTVKASKPATGQYVFVWFTKISQVNDGRFRATLAEASVS